MSITYARAITVFPRCDILVGKNDVQRLGFDKDLTDTQIIALAIKHNSPVIVKNGRNGKWYLKGNGMDMDLLKEKLEEQKGKSREGVYCMLLEMDVYNRDAEQDKEQDKEAVAIEPLSLAEEFATECAPTSEDDCNSCPICLDEFIGEKNKVTTECGHVFHNSCLMKNVFHNGFGCPYCRAKMSNIDEDEDDEDGDDESFDSYGSGTTTTTHTFGESSEENYLLRGARWLFQRAEGDALSDDLPTPSVDFVAQQLMARGFTMSDIVGTFLVSSRRYIEDRDRFIETDTRIQEELNEIICGFTQEQADEQAEREREKRLRDRENAQAIAEEISRKQDQEEYEEFMETMKKFSAKPPSQDEMDMRLIELERQLISEQYNSEQ